jgi:hypothetical protein
MGKYTWQWQVLFIEFLTSGKETRRGHGDMASTGWGDYIKIRI